MMRLPVALLILVLLEPSASFTTVYRQSSSIVASNQRAVVDLKPASTVLFSSSEGEDDSPKSTSFDDAGRSLVDEEDKKRMEEMGDFDSNPNYQMENIEKMREAIRARADDLGVEKSKISQQYFEEARKRAEMNAANNRPGGLDLSQISSGNEPKSQKQQWDEELPSMLYDPTDELTEEERKEADPVGQMQIWEQVITELKSAKWPDFLSALREVAVMFAVVAISGVIIIGWDKTLRSVYTDLGMIPRSEDIPGQMAGLDLPEGFTNGMNEEDLAKMAEEMNSKTPGKASRSGSPSVDALMGDSLKDL